MNNPDFDDRRRSQRLDMEKELVTIMWENDSNESVSRDVMCIDVSSGGLKVEMMHPIAPLTPVNVLFKPNQPLNVTTQCTVLRCVKQLSGWYELALLIEKLEK